MTELDKDKLSHGATVDGRYFPFTRVTISSYPKIIRKTMPTVLGLFLSPSNKRVWKKLRKYAFVKTGLWKWFGIIPKELRLNNIRLKQAKEIKECFFDYVKDEVPELKKSLNSPVPSQTEKKQQK